MHRTGLVIAGVLIAFAPTQAITAEIPPSGASGCSGCHTSSPRLSTAIPGLNGRAAAEVILAMQEFRDGRREATVMDRIAKGFTDGEIQAIADWYAGRK